MKYINAHAILPDMLVEELQKYIQAGYIYIPAKDDQHKSWGELIDYTTNRKGADCKWSAPTPSQLKRLTAKFGRLGAVNLFCFYRVLC